VQLNDDKTEMIWFCSRSNLTKLQRINLSLQVDGTTNTQPSSVVRDLGVCMDSQLTTKEHVAKSRDGRVRGRRGRDTAHIGTTVNRQDQGLF